MVDPNELVIGIRDAIAKQRGGFTKADCAYLEAIANVIAVYFNHGKQYDDRWWDMENADRGAIFELDRKTRRLWSEIWCGVDAPEGADKLESNAADAANGALFLLAVLRQNKGG